jgi:hypothetical protein
MGTRHRLVLGYRKHVPKWVRIGLRTLAILPLAFAVDVGFIYLVASLTQLKLINWETVISFGAVEVLAVALAKILKIGEESEEEKRYRNLRSAVLRLQLVPLYGRLLVVRTKFEETAPEYPESEYYVINTRTKIAYWADYEFDALVKEGILKEEVFEDGAKLKATLNERHIKIEPRYSEGNELFPASKISLGID